MEADRVNPDPANTDRPTDPDLLDPDLSNPDVTNPRMYLDGMSDAVADTDPPLDPPPHSGADPETGSARFRHLPPRIQLKDTVEMKDTRTARDPEGGRDTNRDFMIRYSS